MGTSTYKLATAPKMTKRENAGLTKKR